MKKIIVIFLLIIIVIFLVIAKSSLDNIKENKKLTETTETITISETKSMPIEISEKTTTETSEETTTETFEETTVTTTQELKAEDFIHLNKNKTFNNRYFFKNNIKKISGKMVYESDYEDKETDVNLYIENLGSFENGTLYRLKFRADELTQEYLYEYSDFADERLTIFYYVTSDKIYNVYATQNEIANMTNEKDLLARSAIICQENELKDCLPEEAAGHHHYITVDKNVVEMIEYRDDGFGNSVGYFEHDRFKKDKGLIYYRSGYRLSAGLIIITFDTD